ncbi:MAG: DUF3108 domain-containing protein [Gammaproteobacteria bacterium]
MRTLATVTLLLFLLAPTPLAARSPAPFHAEYALSRGIVKLGTMTRRLTLDGKDGYLFESVMQTQGLAAMFAGAKVVEVSRGEVVDDGFRPVHYRYEKQSKRKDYALSFDYAAGTVSRSDGAADWSAPMPPGLLDKLVYQAQMMLDLADDVPTTLDYHVADRGKLKRYAIEVLPGEVVDTALGGFETRRLVREKPGSKRRTVVWCAPALDWMPVKVEYRDKKGGVTVAVLQRLERSAPRLVTRR